MFSISKLFPKEEKFYRLIEQLSALAGVSSRYLRTLVESADPKERAAAAARIQSAKDEAKRVSTEITKQLCLTFITPFDREDIQKFASNLYKIPKTIDKARQYLALHNMTSVSDLSAQIDVIVSEADAMESMVQALIAGGKTTEIMKQAAILDELENRGDDVLGSLLVQLLKNTTDARELILKKDIYDLLERVIDGYRNSAEVALQIALKHS